MIVMIILIIAALSTIIVQVGAIVVGLHLVVYGEVALGLSLVITFSLSLISMFVYSAIKLIKEFNTDIREEET